MMKLKQLSVYFYSKKVINSTKFSPILHILHLAVTIFNNNIIIKDSVK